MDCGCECPKCKQCLDDAAQRKCDQEVTGTALYSGAFKTDSGTVRAVPPVHVAVYCASCQIWIECDCAGR